MTLKFTQSLLLIAIFSGRFHMTYMWQLSLAFILPLLVLLMCVLTVQQFICTCVNDVGSDASAYATHPSIQ